MKRSFGFLTEHGLCTRPKYMQTRLLIFLWFLALICCSSALGQESTIEGLADRLTQEILKAEKKHFFPKVLVVDFSLRPGGINALGEYLADQLSDAVKQKIGSAAVIDRKKLHSYLQSGGISPFDLADRDVAIWISGEVGANAIVFGKADVSKENLILSTDLIRLGDRKQLGSSKLNLPLNSQLNEFVTKPLDWPTSPEVVVSCWSGTESTGLFKAAGVTEPACIHCPNPDYNDEARKARFQGNLKFDVVVDELGRAKRIAVIKGDENGLTARAIDAIRGWKFKPAMKDGHPVTVCVPIEVVFRLI
ncbi:MAG TPA: energy transducer TonB [Candidatus Acidoferrum sp.]|nr:energy transducer TonB [Candidatus Acidoferrum sp.]